LSTFTKDCFTEALFFYRNGVKLKECAQLLHIFALLELSVAMVAVAMHNVSLSLMIGVLYTPIALVLDSASAHW
jgi:Gaa1-like, GPI transamidase component